MNIVEAVSVLVDDILAEDPIDWGLLPVDENAAKKMIVLSMVEQWENMKRFDNPEVLLLATAAKLALENFALHMEKQ